MSARTDLAIRSAETFTRSLGVVADAELILVLAVALRLWKINDVPATFPYDAAVRSMGSSWHDVLFGALEPSGTIPIDKQPVDL